MKVFVWRLYHAAHLVRLGLPWQDAWTVLGMVLKSKELDNAQSQNSYLRRESGQNSSGSDKSC